MSKLLWVLFVCTLLFSVVARRKRKRKPAGNRRKRKQKAKGSRFFMDHGNWKEPPGFSSDMLDMMLGLQQNDDNSRQAEEEQPHCPGVHPQITCQSDTAGEAHLLRIEGRRGERPFKVVVGGADPISFQSEPGTVFVLRAGGKKGVGGVFLKRWQVSCDPEQDWEFTSDADSVSSVHAYFDVLMPASPSELAAIGNDPIIPPRDRAMALGALLEHFRDNEDLRSAHWKLTTMANVQNRFTWRSYGHKYEPFNLFSNAMSNKLKDKSAVRLTNEIDLFAVSNFLSKSETKALVGTLERAYAHLPRPLLCFPDTQYDAADILDSVGAEAGEGGDFLPYSNCYSEATSSKVLSGSLTAATGLIPKVLDAKVPGEMALLDDVAVRIEKEFGLLDENGGEFMWVMYDVSSGYMSHTDCIKYTSSGKRLSRHKPQPTLDRFATVLISLSDKNTHDLVGGETSFINLSPPLALVPEEGRALVWWNMDKNSGLCSNMTTHQAMPVTGGRKHILMRWYTYHPASEPFRPATDQRPIRKPFTPGVSCDLKMFSGEDHSVSCRQYAIITAAQTTKPTPGGKDEL